MFCTVTAVTARHPCTPHAVIARRSAATPAPPPESVPAIVMTRGGVFVAMSSPPGNSRSQMSGQDVGFGVQAVGVVGAAELGVLAAAARRCSTSAATTARTSTGRRATSAAPSPSTAPAIGPLPGGGACPGSTAPAFSIAASADRSAETATRVAGLEGGGERSAQRDGVHRRNTSAPRPVTKTCL